MWLWDFCVSSTVNCSETPNIIVGIYLGLTVCYLLFPGNLDIIRQNVGFLGLPSSNAAAARAIVAMLISVERNVATYTPIFYHKLRREFLYISVFAFSIAFGLFEDVVLFLICNVSFRVLPPTCLAFGCAVNSCFRNYWFNWKTVFWICSLSKKSKKLPDRIRSHLHLFRFSLLQTDLLEILQLETLSCHCFES